MKSWKKPTLEKVQRAIALLVHAEQYRYFFDRLENPEWIEPLSSKGFFKTPPAVERDKDKRTIRLPPWPESKYLVRMTRYKPRLVAQIIQDMDNTNNAAVHLDLVEALLTMPADVAASIIQKAKTWAESPYILLPENLGQLISHLARGEKAEGAMAIARVLLDILPDPRQKKSAEPDEPYRLPPEPRARLDVQHYEQILKKNYPDLVRKVGLPALALLCDLLDRVIQLSRRRDDDQGPEDYSHIWHAAIEEHPQNIGHTIKGALVSAVRDAAELVVRSKQAPAEEVVKFLEHKRWKVFQRIALHVLKVFSDQVVTLATARLTDRTLFEDIGVQHEYVLLLREHFPHLSSEDQAKILGWIEDAREVDKWKQWVEREKSRQPTKEEVARYREIWQQKWLARIGIEGLPAEWRERYSDLVRRYGKSEHPESPGYMGGVIVGPMSSKTADELKSMSVVEIVEFLKTWEPPENMFLEPSPEGLGRVLSSIVAEEPERFATEALEFQYLDPTYVRAVISGLGDALKQDKAFNWEPVLDLCDWVLSQPQEIPDRQVQELGADPDWGWTRKAIADLLPLGFEDRPGVILIQLRENVWNILQPLTDDPNPTPDYERRYGGSNMSPATLSVNTTRGEAIHAVIRYALWLRRHLEKESDAEERFTKGFSEMPEVREVLNAHLDPEREPSLAVRAVYGQWFPWLVLLDREWVLENVNRIFPVGQLEQLYFDAAWSSYLAFSEPFNDAFSILHEQYFQAIQRIGSHEDVTQDFGNPEEELSKHLMVFYWRGKLALDDPLLNAFWEKGTDALRGYALSFVGQALLNTPEPISNEILARLRKLWEARSFVAKNDPANHEEEMAAFGWWFVSGKFDSEWVVPQLTTAIKIARKVDPDHMVVKELAKIMETYPLEAVKSLKIIVEGDSDGWGIYGWRQYARNILAIALQNVTAKQEAESLIQYLGSRGYLEFRDLLFNN